MCVFFLELRLLLAIYNGGRTAVTLGGRRQRFTFTHDLFGLIDSRIEINRGRVVAAFSLPDV